VIDDLDCGTPGGSARREYERRHAARERRMRERYGPLTGIARLLFPEPQTTSAWERGADGEVEAARWLERRLRGSGVVVLHDRQMPASRANLDHIAVGPGGLTVIDAKAVRGRVRVERRGGPFSRRTQHLVVGGRDRTKLVRGVHRQIEAVRAAVGDDVAVAGALCWMEVSGLPLFGRLEIHGVLVAGPRRVAKLAGRPGVLTAAGVDALAADVARRFPSA
jgi:nuclease-like protein